MTPKSMTKGSRLYFQHDTGEYVLGEWTGFLAGNGDGSDLLYWISCSQCFVRHAVPLEDIYPIDELDAQDFSSETLRERLQRYEDEEQMRYLTRFKENTRDQGSYAKFSFPLVVAGLCACVVGGVKLADGNYFFGGLGVLLFLGAFLFADRLERGA